MLSGLKEKIEYECGCERLVDCADHLPSFPVIFNELLELMNSNSASRQAISSLLRTDPALCTRILSLANSAFHRLRKGNGPVTCIDDAVSIIGIVELAGLVLTTVIVDAFKGIDSSLINMRDFWYTSVRVALSAKHIAEIIGKLDPELLFIQGLLSRIGKLVIYTSFPGMATQVITDSKKYMVPQHDIEERLLGYTHADVGAVLLEKWHLPAKIYAPIKYYIEPDTAPDDLKEAASALHIAKFMQYLYIYDAKLYLGVPGELNQHALDILAIESIMLPAYAAQVDEDFFRIINSLGLNR